MPRLIAKTKLNYATRVIEAGTEFDAETEHDATMLCDTLNAPAERVTAAEPMTTENTAALDPSEQSGRYRHRQMKAKP